MSDTEGEKKIVGRTWPDVTIELFSGLPAWILSTALAGFVGIFAYTSFILDECRTLAVLGKAGPCEAEKQTIAAFPAGSIVAFDLDLKTQAGCPEGWAFFEPAGGRFIIGAGDHDNDWFPEGSDTPTRLTIYPTFAQDDRAGIQETPQARATGGAETHTLLKDEMPVHTHVQRVGQDGVVGERIAKWNITGLGGPVVAAPTEHAGGNKPHNNMPPYIALYYCKKEQP